MTTVTIPVLHVSVRRDANTITPVTVPEHELDILRVTFGQENVLVGDHAGEAGLDPSQEHDRLRAKYDPQVVAEVFGPSPGQLASIVQKAADAAASPARASKAKSAD